MDSTPLSYSFKRAYNVIGVDLAKNVLQIYVISKHGELVSNKIAGRQKLKEILAKSSPSIVGTEGVVVVVTIGDG